MVEGPSREVRGKSKCGPGQPPEPHCCRGRSVSHLPPVAEDHRATALRRVLCNRCSPELALQVVIQRFHPSRKKDFEGGREARAPVHWTCTEFPPVTHSRKSPATLNPCRNRFRTSHAFRFKHLAAGCKLTQCQIEPRLCKNCGGQELLVESEGKTRRYFHAMKKTRKIGI
jgi:hypothetical protein